MAADRRQRPDRRPAAAVLHPVGVAAELHPSRGRRRRLSRWPAWRSPATRSGSASGSARPSRRRSRTSRSSGSPRTAPRASSPRSCRRRRARPDLTPDLEPRSRPARASQPGAVPSPNIWHHTATYELENRAADPDGRLEAAMAPRSSLGRPRRARPRLRHRLPPARASPARRGVGHRRRAAPRPGARWRGVVPATLADGRRHAGHRQDAPAPRRLRRRGARPVGLLLRPGLRAGPAPSSTGSYAAAAPRSSSTTTPTRSTFGGWFRARLPATSTRRRSSGSGPPAAGPRTRSTWAGGSAPAPTSRPSCGSSSNPRSPTRSCRHDGIEVDYAVNLWSRRVLSQLGGAAA